MIDVKIIQQSGHSALVEWLDNGKRKRATIPQGVIQDNQVLKSDLEMGIPYGIEWSKVIELSASSEDLQQELYRVGIWTADDAINNADRLRGALQKVYSVDIGTIMKLAKEERSK